MQLSLFGQLSNICELIPYTPLGEFRFPRFVNLFFIFKDVAVALGGIESEMDLGSVYVHLYSGVVEGLVVVGLFAACYTRLPY